MPVSLTGPSIFQLPPSSDLVLADVIATPMAQAQTDNATIPNRHKVTIAAGSLQITGPALQIHRPPLLMLNQSYEGNAHAVREKARQLAESGMIECARIGVNTVEGGVLFGAVGGGLKAGLKGSIYGGAPGALIGAAVGSMTVLTISAVRSYRNAAQRNSLREINTVFHLYDKILQGQLSPIETANALLELEHRKEKISKAALNAHKELERILLSVTNDPDIVNLMRMMPQLVNGLELQKARH